MKYITGIHALNLRCSLETCGDWHQSGIQWTRPTIRDSAESVFGDFGIEKNSNVPENPGTHWVADHIRALLDLLAEQSFSFLVTFFSKEFNLENPMQVCCLNLKIASSQCIVQFSVGSDICS